MATQAPSTFKPTAKQWQAIQAIRSRVYRYILTGGAMSTAKSYGGAMIILSIAKRFPRTRHGVFRKNMTVIKRTIWQTFKKVAFDMGMAEGLDYRVNRQDMYWEIAADYNSDGSPNWETAPQIWFMELDETKDPDWNKIKGLELTDALIDEANEVQRDAFTILGSRIGRENKPREEDGVVPTAFMLLTCNPSDNWVKDDFHDPWVKDELRPPYLFIPSLPEDNPHNSPEYLAALHAMPLQFRKRYVEGNWDYVDDSNALFPNRVIDRALVSELEPVTDRRIGVDVAREGTDKIIFALIEGDTLTDLYEPDIDRSEDSPISDLIATELILYMKRNNVGYEFVTVDAVGNGGGVIDACRRQEYFVKSFKSGEKATDAFPDGTPKYDMLRSERYWKLAQAMDSGQFKIYAKTPNLEELRKDLLAHTYEIKDKVTMVESKEKMKKRLRRSPDFSDAVVMGWRPKASSQGSGEVELYGSYADWFKDED